MRPLNNDDDLDRKRAKHDRDKDKADPIAEADRKRESERRKKEEETRKNWREMQNKEPALHYSPWLVIRYALYDLGLRPIPAGDIHWKSPDIWVESSDPLGNAVAGEDNFIHARIFNLGMAMAAPVKVDFYWANPALGLGPANMNLIGEEWVEIGSLESKTVRCNTAWAPVYVNNGHECLEVNCSNHILDPIIYPFQPRLDRHVGQRNIHVLEAAAGETVAFSLELNNFFPLPALTTIEVRTEQVVVAEAALKQLDATAIINHVVAYGEAATNTAQEMEGRFVRDTLEHRTARKIARMRRSHPVAKEVYVLGLSEMSRAVCSQPRILASISERLGYIAPSERREQMANLMLASYKYASSSVYRDTRHTIALESITLKAFEQRRVSLELGIPAGARGGEYIAFHLSQRVEEMAVGGYAIVVRVTDKKEKTNERRKQMNEESSKVEAKQGRNDILKLIVEEVDEARETYELVMQLKAGLPIRSFDDIRKSCADHKTIKFRGNVFDLDTFEDRMPSFIFPIDDIRKLIELVYVAVESAPRTIEYDMEVPENAKRRIRRQQLQSLIPTGVIGPARLGKGGAGLFGGIRTVEQQKIRKEEQ